MKIHISPRHLTLTSAIRDYVDKKIGNLEHLVEEVIGAHVVLWHDGTRNPKKSFVVKVHLALPGPDIHAEDAEHDLYAAVDKIVDKLAKQLRHRKTKLTTSRIRASRKVKKELQEFETEPDEEVVE